MIQEIPYRASIPSPVFSEPEPASTRDEIEFSTLKSVATKIEARMEALSSDFDSFTILRGIPKEDALHDLMIQIMVRQEVKSFLVSLAEEINSSIGAVESKIKITK